MHFLSLAELRKISFLLFSLNVLQLALRLNQMPLMQKRSFYGCRKIRQNSYAWRAEGSLLVMGVIAVGAYGSHDQRVSDATERQSHIPVTICRNNHKYQQFRIESMPLETQVCTRKTTNDIRTRSYICKKTTLSISALTAVTNHQQLCLIFTRNKHGYVLNTVVELLQQMQ